MYETIRDFGKSLPFLPSIWRYGKQALGLTYRQKYTLSTPHPEDVWVVSYPKSGNTWVRFLLSDLLSGGQPVSWDRIDEYVPDIYQARDRIQRMSGPRFIKSHEAWFDHYPRCIYICRDGRDVMVSYYHYLKGFGRDVKDFSYFLREYSKWPGSWVDHVEAALNTRKDAPDNILIVRFEDLKEDAVRELRRMAEFAGIKVSNQDLIRAVEHCQLSNLRALEERKTPTSREDATNEFFRSGKTKQWESVFTEEDLEFFYEDAGNVLSKLSYR